jgi:CrcB protein
MEQPRGVDPDVDLHEPDQAREWQRHRFVLPAIALGGMVGASARHGADLLWPTSRGEIPWATLGVNVVGGLLLGVLMVLVVEARGRHPLWRPFAGVGVLGGFTTFSTYVVETDALLRDGRPGLAFAYLAGTLVLALSAVTVGLVATRAALGRRRWGRAR